MRAADAIVYAGTNDATREGAMESTVDAVLRDLEGTGREDTTCPERSEDTTCPERSEDTTCPERSEDTTHEDLAADPAADPVPHDPYMPNAYWQFSIRHRVGGAHVYDVAFVADEERASLRFHGPLVSAGESMPTREWLKTPEMLLDRMSWLVETGLEWSLLVRVGAALKTTAMEMEHVLGKRGLL